MFLPSKRGNKTCRIRKQTRENPFLTITKILIECYRFRNMAIRSCHLQSNEVVELGHHQIVDGLAKLVDKLVRNLALVLLADRITTRLTIRHSPHRGVFGQDSVLLIELTAASWVTNEWKKIKTRPELLASRARQLERRMQDVGQAKINIRQNRLRNKACFDKNLQERIHKVDMEHMVLLYNSVLDKQ